MAMIFDNIQEAIFQVRSLIQGVGEVRKLVYYDSKDALEQADIPYSTPAEHFVVSAVFDVTEPPFDKNTLISVIFERGTQSEEDAMIKGVMKINILTRSQLWELDNNKIRPMEIANHIVKNINNRKVSNSHKIVFSSIEATMLNEDVNGYSLTFSLEEGSGFSGKF